jgi:hypothetical protein
LSASSNGIEMLSIGVTGLRACTFGLVRAKVQPPNPKVFVLVGFFMGTVCELNSERLKDLEAQAVTCQYFQVSWPNGARISSFL